MICGEWIYKPIWMDSPAPELARDSLEVSMKIGNVIPVVLPALVAFLAIALFDPAGGAARPPAPPIVIQGDLFDPVFAIMNDGRGPDSLGCRGCHIGPQPGFGPWWGDDRDTVLATLESGVTPDGQVLDPPPLDGGRKGILGRFVHQGTMPLGGMQWDDDSLAILDKWLQTYE
jgi:hypothetical protein